MPELPEVETTLRGLTPHLLRRRVIAAHLRRPDLRWPIAEEITTLLPGQRIIAARRRAKYLLLDTVAGSVLLHLGMSGSLRVLPASVAPRQHDHVDLLLDDGHVLRFNDPRRFGSVLWQDPDHLHPLLQRLGPEPLEPEFDGQYLFSRSRGRKTAIKTFLMDQAVVVGVGNIYATEALFAARINPLRAAGRVSLASLESLALHVKQILGNAIASGGTTLRDFIRPDGAPGYFALELAAYGHGGEPCPRCGTHLKQALVGQRTTVWCTRCQR